MARTPKTAAPTKTTSTALVSWEDQLAKEAEVAAKMEESSAGGQFFSVKGGQLSWGGNPFPNNEMAVIIVDSIFETVYYEGKYDPDEVQGPTAFAFGRVQEDMTWHENSREDFAGQLCSESEVCKWGSADVGKGKAARETRRLAMIPAGHFDKNGDFEMIEDEDHFANTQIGFMRLPVTSVKGYASFVKQVAGTLKRPPYGIITKVKVVPDPKTQFKVLFEPIMTIPDDFMEVVVERHNEAMSIIDFPYAPYEESVEVEEKPKAKSSRAAKPASRRKY